MTEPEGKGMRRLGLRKATAVGVGAIVGGGVLVLAGPAFQAAGPGALLAFAFNGVLALLTAMSFAEMSSRFPESGGAYTYAKKVLSVQAAFGVGWILWFAYIVAGVLYAMGFAEYAVAGAAELLGEGTGVSRAWVTVLAFLAVATSTGLLARGQGGAGQWAVPAKLIVFAVLIVVGGACWLWQGPEPGFSRLDPVFPTGVGGVVQAMGLTFIAFQGFDSIATIAGEVKEPGRTLPRAMFYSLGAALLVYLPLLFLVAAGGTIEGESIQSVAAQYPETVVAVAIRRLMGDAGYWFVIVAAVLSTLTALHANLLAASRVAYRMAQDRTLPRVIADGDSRTGTPLMAIYATALASVAILLMVRDLSAAGAAASLIFLIAFALAHMTSFLARQRYAGSGEGVYEAPAFPWVPLVGGIACGGMAVFQVITAPDAGGVIAVWLGFGGLLYFSLFRSRARTVDAMLEAHDPSLAQLRGRSPLVLVPVSNPTTAAAMAAVGNAVAAPQVGRVLLLSVMAPPASEGEAEAETGAVLTRAERIFRAALTESMGAGFTPETLFTIAKDPWDEIRRVATARDCESILLGLSSAGNGEIARLEALLNRIVMHAVVLHAPEGWKLESAKRVLVAVGGKGKHDELRARLLGSLVRLGQRRITFARVVPEGAVTGPASLNELRALADEETPTGAESIVVRGANVTDAISELAESIQADLIVMGTPRQSGKKSLGRIALGVANQAGCATLMICRESTVTLAIDRLSNDIKQTVTRSPRGG